MAMTKTENRPTTRARMSSDPLRPSSVQTEAAAKQAAAAQRLASQGKHDGMCLRTYADRHLGPITQDQPAPSQTPRHCHCLCPSCWDKPTSTCVCSRCTCRSAIQPATSTSPTATVAHRAAQSAQRRAAQAPQVGFLPPI